MANILDKYGIKEVADVTIYSIAAGGVTTPVLFLDTLKVSTIEQTAEQSEAKGGKGNSPLIIWDFGKELTVTLEDALFTPKSMQIMFGSGSTALTGAITTITKMVYTANLSAYTAAQTALLTTQKPTAFKYYQAADMSEIATAVTATWTNPAYVLETWGTASNLTAYTIDVSANSFPGTYKIVGDTYARNKETGIDEYFQFIIPQAKMGPENTITLEAEGDPTVFNMTMRVLRPADGVMMKLIKYTI